MENNAQKLQAILYAHGGELKKSNLERLLKATNNEIAEYISDLSQLLEETGLELIETSSTVSLRSASKYSEFIRDLQKDNREKDIGSAGLEVLSIVLYKGGASRVTIDYIRGVNSSGTLRQLVLRGLLEKTKDTNDSRTLVYNATVELLAFLGISSINDLPEYEELKDTLSDDKREIIMNN